jgi:hypothetical protein
MEHNGMMPLTKTDQNIGVTISLFAIVLVLVYIVLPLVGFNDEIMMLAALGLIVLISLGVSIFITRKYRKENQPLMIDYLNVGTQRYILGIFMVFYGVPKLLGNFFDYQLSALDSKMADVSEFELAWYFYGKNRWQELFSGIMEFIPGLLLLRRRTYYIAALILLPVTTQVFLLNFFFRIGGITLPAATILLACNLYIIYSQKAKIISFFKSLHFDFSVQGKTLAVIKRLRGIAILLIGLILISRISPLFFRSANSTTYQRLVGMYTLQEMKKNNRVFLPANDSLYYKDLYIEKQDRWNILRRYNNKTDAFLLHIHTGNDSVALYVNKGGIGDDPDIIDSLTVLKGTYKLDGNTLVIKGIQLKDTLELAYKRQDNIRPKEWFW